MLTNYEGIRVAVAVPSTERTFLSEFSDSFFALARPMNSVYIRPKGAGPLDHIRNELVLVAQKMMCTHVWMADTDQIYPQDTLIKLLSNELPVVAAKVHRRYPPYDPILLRGKHGNYKAVPEDEWKVGGLVKVDATGCGSILYEMKVFEDVPYPWFEFHLEDEANPIGEDVDFCQKLGKAGIPIHVDCDVKVGHMAMNVITEEAYWAYKFSQNKGPVVPRAMTLPKKKNPNVKMEWEGEQDGEEKEGQ